MNRHDWFSIELISTCASQVLGPQVSLSTALESLLVSWQAGIRKASCTRSMKAGSFAHQVKFTLSPTQAVCVSYASLGGLQSDGSAWPGARRARGALAGLGWVLCLANCC